MKLVDYYLGFGHRLTIFLKNIAMNENNFSIEQSPSTWAQLARNLEYTVSPLQQ